MIGSVVVTALIFTAFVVVFAAHRIVTPMEGVKEYVDIGGEANLPTWWNSTLLALAAAGAVLAAWTIAATAPAQRRAWYVVAIAALYLSVDEATEIHERFARIADALGIESPTFAWVIPGAFAAALGVGVLIAAGRRLPRIVARRLGFALALYGTGAVGVEALNGWMRDRTGNRAYTLGTMVEEALEMGACVLAVVALVDLFAERRGSDAARRLPSAS